ncbi:hypothetical protein HanLR1_Chr17g0670311 [Helianthus annuus]|nr:hypothetical protein HanHA89_Chr17g0711741 [Helianthus annuus]KAJ0632892.1 hypothetical protein HanLR1_Chr17g0670311 [Helianthus annuus]
MYWKLMYHAHVTAGYHQSLWSKIGRVANPVINQYAPFLNSLISTIQRWWFRYMYFFYIFKKVQLLFQELLYWMGSHLWMLSVVIFVLIFNFSFHNKFTRTVSL